MTKEQARALLRKWPGVGQLEGWIADQPWRMVRDGWVVGVEFHGCRFRLEPVETGLHHGIRAAGETGGLDRLRASRHASGA